MAGQSLVGRLLVRALAALVVVGALGLWLGLGDWLAHKNSGVQNIAALLLAAGSLAAWLGRELRRLMVRPLDRLTEAIEREGTGETGAVQAVTLEGREFERFSQTLAAMLAARDEEHRELRRSEAELRLLGQISRVADRAEEFDEALRAACELVCRYLSWPVGHIYLFRSGPEGDCLVPSNIWHLAESELAHDFVERTRSLELSPGEDLPGRVLERGDPLWLEDCWRVDWFQRSRAHRGPVRGGVAFPARVAQETIAVIEMYDFDPRQRDIRTMALMHNIGPTSRNSATYRAI